jgi:hypothetical protein
MKQLCIGNRKTIANSCDHGDRDRGRRIDHLNSSYMFYVTSSSFSFSDAAVDVDEEAKETDIIVYTPPLSLFAW